LKDIVVSGLARKKPQMPSDYKPNCMRSHSTTQWIAPDNAFAGYDLLSLVEGDSQSKLFIEVKAAPG
jgi:hypothetical protein